MNATIPRYRAALIRIIWLVSTVLLTWAILFLLSNRTSFLYSIRGLRGSVPPMGTLIDPFHGLWYTARTADHKDATEVIEGLKGAVEIVRDDRGVPHIFAETDRDAVIATGYVTAQDRLFQLDFIPRAAAGRLSEVFGPDLIATDRYLRSTGMEWGARRNLDSIEVDNQVEKDLLDWFSLGVNAYLDGLADYQLPVEFRLLDYRPNRYQPIDAIRVLQYMAFDLSFRTDDPSYGKVRRMMNEKEYEKLFPTQSHLYVPIVPDRPSAKHAPEATSPDSLDTGWVDIRRDLRFPGFEPGKGSNNWAVTGVRSATGHAILAGDMHLDLTLPSIWYEIHISTPKMNTRGVLIPGSPLPIEAFNGRFAWAFTNTGADQTDHYRLQLDSTRTAYRFNEKWLPFELLVDSIEVRGMGAVPDTVRLTRFGPVMNWRDEPVAVQWTAHKRARTLQALWWMHHASGLDEFQDAIRYWDSPMQNILFADASGNIAIRSTGYLPIRRRGRGDGLLDGTTDQNDWVGRIPFDELPYAANPESGFLASTNQQPAGSWYPYYLGHDWSQVYRSIRINELLRGKPKHGVPDMMAYQADVHAVQRDLFVPFLDSLTDLSEDARELRRILDDWDGRATVDAIGPLVLDEYLKILQNLAWDEFDDEHVRRPRQVQLYYLLSEEPNSRWLDIRSTDLMKETGPDLVRLALEATADTMRSKYGWDQSAWRWDLHHSLLIRHMTHAEALSPLGVGPISFPGFANTLSVAAGRVTTHAASWRMIVDFSTASPEGYGVFPGGESGNPFSQHYADQVAMFAHFGYYRLTRPARINDLVERQISSRLRLNPVVPPAETD